MKINDFNKLLEISSEYISEWQILSNDKHFDDAKQKAQEFINICKENIVECNNSHDEITLNYFLVLGVLFRGFQNFNEIDKLTYLADWINENEQVEKVWVELWDCKERLEFCFDHLILEDYLQSFLINNLDRLENHFLEVFGHGLYASPEIIIKKIKCSICGNDLRRCEHQIGLLYYGKICTTIMEDFFLKNVAIVRVPEDPRCRIWPWNKIEKKKYNIPILRVFRIDDFINS